MKKNKGFTLVELLAVIVVLAIILAIAIPSVLNVISNTRYNSFKSNEELFVKTTKTYLASNNNLLPQTLNETSKVFLNDLINNSYMEDIKDPLSNNSCNSIASYVLITNTGVNKYSYKPALVCDNYISVDNFNLISNDDFSDGITGWTVENAIISTSLNELIQTPTARYGGVYQMFSNYAQYANHKIYFSAYIKVDDLINVYLVLNDGTYQAELSGTKVGTYHRISDTLTVAAAPTKLFFKLQDGRINNWTASYLKKGIVIDLTAIYGAGNEPTKDQMDKIISNMQE